jgi:DHA2 family multidrug resistance protein-like MFS transporter
LLLIVVDMTVLYTALPALTRDLRADASEKLWIINAYALVVSGLLLGTGALSDRLGHRKLFTAGLTVFGIASLFAAFSPSPAHLIAARALLGIGAAMMMPATLSIIRITFLDSRERAFAIGIWAAVAAGGAAFGPVLGGVLLQYFWWGSVFLINVPIVILSLITAFTFIPASPPNPARRWDLLGSLQVMIGLIGVAYAIKELGKSAPALQTAAIAGLIGVVFLILFVRRQRLTTPPMLDFRIFQTPGFTPDVIAALIFAAMLMGVELALTKHLQLVLGMTPLQAGLAILPLPLAAFVADPVAGRLLPSIGARRLLPGAMFLAGVGMRTYVMLLNGGLTGKILALVLLGVGIGGTITAASDTIMHNAPPEHAGTAASVEEVSYEFGGAIGVTIIGSVLSAIYSAKMAHAPGGADARDSLDQALLMAQDMVAPQAEALVLFARAASEQGFVIAVASAATILIITAGIISVHNRRAARHHPHTAQNSAASH